MTLRLKFCRPCQFDLRIQRPRAPLKPGLQNLILTLESFWGTIPLITRLRSVRARASSSRISVALKFEDVDFSMDFTFEIAVELRVIFFNRNVFFAQFVRLFRPPRIQHFFVAGNLDAGSVRSLQPKAKTGAVPPLAIENATAPAAALPIIVASPTPPVAAPPTAPQSTAVTPPDPIRLRPLAFFRSWSQALLLGCVGSP